MRYNEHKGKPIQMANCPTCKGNDFRQVKIPANRKPHCCRDCYELRRKTQKLWDWPSFEKIEYDFENIHGMGWYDNWPMED
mgnify:FL=1